MAKNRPNPKVDFFFTKAAKWQPEVKKLRKLLLDSGVTEELKWGCPCYTFEGRNVVLIHTFKDYCAVLFFKGALLNDPAGILVQQTKNVQSARQMRFTSLPEVVKAQTALKAYVAEAIAVEKAGRKVNFKKTADFGVPAEFQKALGRDPDLKEAFAALTPGRQRAYLLYFSAAKQPKTREARIEKYRDQILDGKGMHDD